MVVYLLSPTFTNGLEQSHKQLDKLGRSRLGLRPNRSYIYEYTIRMQVKKKEKKTKMGVSLHENQG